MSNKRPFPPKEETYEQWKFLPQIQELSLTGCRLKNTLSNYAQSLFTFEYLLPFLKYVFANTQNHLKALTLEFCKSDVRFLLPPAPPLLLVNVRQCSCSAADLEQLLINSGPTLQKLSCSLWFEYLTGTNLAPLLAPLTNLQELCLELYTPDDNRMFLESGATDIFNSLATLSRLTILFAANTVIPASFIAILRATKPAIKNNLTRLDLTVIELHLNLINLIHDSTYPSLKILASPSFRTPVGEEALELDEMSGASDLRRGLKQICAARGVEVVEAECFEYYSDGVKVM